MKRLGALVGLALVTLGGAALASRDAVQEAGIDGAVAKIDPGLRATVHAGNDAVDRRDWAAAVQAYAAVHAAAPNVVPVTRRLGMAEVHLGHLTDGVAHCREARDADPSAENHAALAYALIQQPFVIADTATAALAEARAAVKKAPDAQFAQVTLCDVAVVEGRADVLDSCTRELRRIAPGDAETHLFGAHLELAHDDAEGAERELAAARTAGLDAAQADAMEERIVRTRPRGQLAQQLAIGVATAFVGTLFLLFVVGMLLSDAAERLSSRTRKLYFALLRLGAAFYWVFSLVCGVVLLMATTAVVYAFVVVASPPRYVEILAGVVAAYVLVAIVRASLSEPAPTPSIRIDLARETALDEALESVAKEVGVRPVDEVRIRPDAAVELVEQGRKRTRVLFVGVFALDGLSRRAFDALVAHEMARLRGAGGRAVISAGAFDARVDRMVRRGVASPANPVWWIVSAYRMFYARIAEGAFELQERDADEQVATLYGNAALLEGLKHVVRRQLDAEIAARDIVREVALGADAEPSSKGEARFEAAWQEHADREERIESLEDEGLVSPRDGDARELFSTPEIGESARAQLRGLISEELGLEAAPSP